jgi:hypothetical protein
MSVCVSGFAAEAFAIASVYRLAPVFPRKLAKAQIFKEVLRPQFDSLIFFG